MPADPHTALPEGFHIGFTGADPDEVIGGHTALSAAGVPVGTLEDNRPNTDYVTFRCWDPDGTEIEIFWEP